MYITNGGQKESFKQRKKMRRMGKWLAVWRWLLGSPAQTNECPCLELPGFGGFVGSLHPHRSGEIKKPRGDFSSKSKS